MKDVMQAACPLSCLSKPLLPESAPTVARQSHEVVEDQDGAVAKDFEALLGKLFRSVRKVVNRADRAVAELKRNGSLVFTYGNRRRWAQAS